MVRRRTSTPPGDKTADVRSPAAVSATQRRKSGAARTVVALGGEPPSAPSARRPPPVDWRWGRTTRPIGWSVAPWRSTRMVRSLAATEVVVTTAPVRRHLRGHGCGVAEEEVVPRPSLERGHREVSGRVVRVVAHRDHVGPRPRPGRGPGMARRSDGAASPRSGSTSPGPRATSQVPSASSPTGSASGTYGVKASCSPRAVMVHVPRRPVQYGLERCRARRRAALSTRTSRRRPTRRSPGPSGSRGSSCSVRPNRQFAASKEWSAGASAKRRRRVAASTASSETGCLSPRSPLNGSTR